MPLGICKLCLREKALQYSHLLPAAAYAHLRGTAPGEEHPIFVSSPRGADEAVMLQTSKQVQDYVLCWDCEQLLCNRGENWVLERLAVGVASPLYFALEGLDPVIDEPGFKAYSVIGNPEFDVDKVSHFALGVFFKIGAHEWVVGRNKRKLEYGPYLGALREYLLGRTGFPANCTLMLTIHPPTNGPKRMSIPTEWERDISHTYGFMLIGLDFSMSLGKLIPQWHRDLCFATGSSKIVIVADVTKQQADNTVERIIQRGQVKGKLGKRLPPQYPRT
jgi:hypothetical protein